MHYVTRIAPAALALLALSLSACGAGSEPAPPAPAAALSLQTPAPDPAPTPLPVPANAMLLPELSGITGWVNTGPFTLESLRGKVVLVEFWTYGCYNCLNVMPYVKDWHARYAEAGLEIVGVHSPEFAYEEKLENVAAFIEENDIGWKVALDNDFRTWTAYGNRYWPRFYLADTEGRIRYDHVGEGGYEETEAWIRGLLTESGADVSGIPAG